MAANCDPETLVEGSKCFMCLSPDQLDALIAYQLCAWAVNASKPN